MYIYVLDYINCIIIIIIIISCCCCCYYYSTVFGTRTCPWSVLGAAQGPPAWDITRAPDTTAGADRSPPATASQMKRESRGRKSSKNTRADRNKQLPREHVALLAVIYCRGEVLLPPSAADSPERAVPPSCPPMGPGTGVVGPRVPPLG